MNPHRVGLLLLMVGLWMGWGCDGDGDITHCGGPERVGSILIFMPTDTLAFLPGDTASVDGWALVTNDAGRVMSHVTVSLSLLPESFGSLELLGAMGDMTNELGRVYFRFHSFEQTGITTIRAQVEDKEDLWVLTVLPSQSRLAHVTIAFASPEDSAGLHSPDDSLAVCLTLADSSNQGIPGIIFPLRSSGGRLSPIGPTDASGEACCWWYLMGLEPGFHCLTFASVDFADSVCVEVDAPVHLTSVDSKL